MGFETNMSLELLGKLSQESPQFCIEELFEHYVDLSQAWAADL